MEQSLTPKELGQLNEKIAQYKEHGFPTTVSLDEKLKNLNEQQKIVFNALVDAIGLEKGIQRNALKKGTYGWSVIENVRLHIQRVILVGFDDLEIIQKYMVAYGAIPDPEESWKYYFLPNGKDYACWECHSEIMAQEQIISIHDGPFPLSGSGRTERKVIPYCPKCEDIPSSSGVRRVDPNQELIEEIARLQGKQN